MRIRVDSQIRYYTWGSNKDHPHYFNDIERIASWIAWSLEAQESSWRKRPMQLTTIAVHQHKEKMGSVRVYCTFSHPVKVDREWRERLKTWRSGGSKTPKPRKDVFCRSCEIQDMRWYRGVYRDAVEMWPQYQRAILDDADFPYLLGTLEDAEAAHLRGCITKRDWDAYRTVLRRSEDA